MCVQSGRPNKDGCWIQVNYNWNFKFLEQKLVNYHDKDIIDLLKYGWLIEHSSEVPLELGGTNHKGATCYQDHVDKYIEKELKHGATIGPFECIPFSCQVAVSPVSTRAKRESTERCIIMDCSWPIGASLNDGIDRLLLRYGYRP